DAPAGTRWHAVGDQGILMRDRAEHRRSPGHTDRGHPGRPTEGALRVPRDGDRPRQPDDQPRDKANPRMGTDPPWPHRRLRRWRLFHGVCVIPTAVGPTRGTDMALRSQRLSVRKSAFEFSERKVAAPRAITTVNGDNRARRQPSCATAWPFS